jgi:hypothetical protein
MQKLEIFRKVKSKIPDFVTENYNYPKRLKEFPDGKASS